MYDVKHQRIDENNVIKVADFGLCEDVYNSGYFSQSREEAVSREERVPIRWMAPESIENGRYSEKTDVVSSTFCNEKCVLCVCVCVCVCVCIVGIWSDMLGNIHLWEGPLCWDQSLEHPKAAEIWRTTGETQ